MTAALDARAEINRLTAALARAVPGSTVGYASFRPLSAPPGSPEEVYAKVIVDTLCPDGSMDEARVITTSRATADEAVAELRAILRADTAEAVAELRAEVARLRGLPMTARRLTASGLALAAACPAAYALPAVEDHETDAMRAGTQRHAWLDAFALAWEQRRAQGGSPDAAYVDAGHVLPADPTARATCEAIDLERLLDVTGARGGTIEVATVLTWWPATDSAEEMLGAGHRQYRDDPTALHGTADWIVTAPDGSVTVVDFKGSMRGAPAAEHLQINWYALAYARARGLDRIAVALVYIDEDGTLTDDRATLDAWDLDAWAARFANIYARVAAAVAAPVEHTRVGDHCGNCPAIRVCPAMAGLARELVASPPSPEAYPALDDAAAGAAWAKVQVLRELLDRAAAALRVRAERRGLPLPDGRWLTPVESSRRTVDVEKALPVLRQLVGERAEGLVERSLSAAAVDAVVRELAAASGDTAKATGERVWTALREAKAARDSTYVQLRPRKLAGGA